jgi:transcriptional regulator with XRE-family HTH domain
VSIRSDDLDGLTTGQRIQILRERKGLSRPALAGLLGMSAEWLKAVETGRLQTPRLPVLVRIGAVLRIRDVADLAGADMGIGDASVSVPLLRKDAGTRIRSARRRRGLSLEVTAALVGRSKAWLSMIETGKLELDRLGDIFALAAVLQVPVPVLTGIPCPGCPAGAAAGADASCGRTVLRPARPREETL